MTVAAVERHAPQEATATELTGMLDAAKKSVLSAAVTIHSMAVVLMEKPQLQVLTMLAVLVHVSASQWGHMVIHAILIPGSAHVNPG